MANERETCRLQLVEHLFVVAPDDIGDRFAIAKCLDHEPLMCGDAFSASETAQLSSARSLPMSLSRSSPVIDKTLYK